MGSVNAAAQIESSGRDSRQGAAAADSTGRHTSAESAASLPAMAEGRTRRVIAQLLLEEGPITAGAIGSRLGLAPAGVRRHLDALIASGQARATGSAPWQHRGRGRPAKQYRLTPAGRGQFRQAYDDLASAALRHVRDIGGTQAVLDFARQRARTVTSDVEPVSETRTIEATTTDIAEALTRAGFAASTRKVGLGVQLCQHHCPVAHVAEEFPELCAAELETFRDLLGIHVQRLATIANGDCACTTHVPLTTPSSPTAAARPAGRQNDSGRGVE